MTDNNRLFLLSIARVQILNLFADYTFSFNMFSNINCFIHLEFILPVDTRTVAPCTYRKMDEDELNAVAYLLPLNEKKRTRRYWEHPLNTRGESILSQERHITRTPGRIL